MCNKTLPAAQNPDPPPTYSYQKKHRLADIYRLYWKDYQRSKNRKLYLEDRHRQAVYQTLHCRTSRLGYHVFSCQQCEQKRYLYHSCKHRFCGSCGAAETYRWAEARLNHLLDIKHHHVVFTLPAGLRPLAHRNSILVYDLLFQTTSKVLQDWFAYKHQLKCGVVSVLHTAGSDLKYHPHLHLIVSGGGYHLKTRELTQLPGEYLCRAQHLKRRFRWEFERGLIQLYEQGKLQLPANLCLGRRYFLSFLKQLNQHEWVVSVQPSLADRSHIVKYVGRYTKRACLSESRIQSIKDGLVSFSYKDYKHTPPGEKPRQASLCLPYSQFLDRLLLHVPKKNYRMVRYYGLYANRNATLSNATPKEATPSLATPTSALDQPAIAPGQPAVDTAQPVEAAAPDFSRFEQHFAHVYGQQALQCQTCAKPFVYRGQFFATHTHPLPTATPGFQPAITRWDSS